MLKKASHNLISQISSSEALENKEQIIKEWIQAWQNKQSSVNRWADRKSSVPTEPPQSETNFDPYNSLVKQYNRQIKQISKIAAKPQLKPIETKRGKTASYNPRKSIKHPVPARAIGYAAYKLKQQESLSKSSSKSRLTIRNTPTRMHNSKIQSKQFSISGQKKAVQEVKVKKINKIELNPLKKTVQSQQVSHRAQEIDNYRSNTSTILAASPEASPTAPLGSSTGEHFFRSAYAKQKLQNQNMDSLYSSTQDEEENLTLPVKEIKTDLPTTLTAHKMASPSELDLIVKAQLKPSFQKEPGIHYSHRFRAKPKKFNQNEMLTFYQMCLQPYKAQNKKSRKGSAGSINDRSLPTTAKIDSVTQSQESSAIITSVTQADVQHTEPILEDTETSIIPLPEKPKETANQPDKIVIQHSPVVSSNSVVSTVLKSQNQKKRKPDKGIVSAVDEEDLSVSDWSIKSPKSPLSAISSKSRDQKKRAKKDSSKQNQDIEDLFSEKARSFDRREKSNKWQSPYQNRMGRFKKASQENHRVTTKMDQARNKPNTQRTLQVKGKSKHLTPLNQEKVKTIALEVAPLNYAMDFARQDPEEFGNNSSLEQPTFAKQSNQSQPKTQSRKRSPAPLLPKKLNLVFNTELQSGKSAQNDVKTENPNSHRRQVTYNTTNSFFKKYEIEDDISKTHSAERNSLGFKTSKMPPNFKATPTIFGGQFHRQKKSNRFKSERAQTHNGPIPQLQFNQQVGNTSPSSIHRGKYKSTLYSEKCQKKSTMATQVSQERVMSIFEETQNIIKSEQSLGSTQRPIRTSEDQWQGSKGDMNKDLANSIFVEVVTLNERNPAKVSSVQTNTDIKTIVTKVQAESQWEEPLLISGDVQMLDIEPKSHYNKSKQLGKSPKIKPSYRMSGDPYKTKVSTSMVSGTSSHMSSVHQPDLMPSYFKLNQKHDLAGFISQKASQLQLNIRKSGQTFIKQPTLNTVNSHSSVKSHANASSKNTLKNTK